MSHGNSLRELWQGGAAEAADAAGSQDTTSGLRPQASGLSPAREFTREEELDQALPRIARCEYEILSLKEDRNPRDVSTCGE